MDRFTGQTVEVVLVGTKAFAKLTSHRTKSRITAMYLVILITAVCGSGYCIVCRGLEKLT